jgi:hypothetical protein
MPILPLIEVSLLSPEASATHAPMSELPQSAEMRVCISSSATARKAVLSFAW